MRKKVRKLATRREVAETLGVHMQTITGWERQGLPIAKRGGKGVPSKYDLEAVRAWIAARDGAARKAVDGPLDPIQEKAARDHWQAELAEQTYKIRQKTLLPADEVERAWTTEVAAVRAKLLALPTTFSDRIFREGTLHGLAGVERMIQAAVHDVLRQLSGAGTEADSGEAA